MGEEGESNLLPDLPISRFADSFGSAGALPFQRLISLVEKPSRKAFRTHSLCLDFTILVRYTRCQPMRF